MCERYLSEIGKNKIKVIAIDPGSRIAGFAVCECSGQYRVSGSDFKVIDVGVVRLNVKKVHSERLYELQVFVSGLIEKYQPDLNEKKKAFCGVNPSSALKLGEVRGALIALAYSYKVKLVELTPRYVKTLLTGKGAGSKDEVAQGLKRLIGFTKGTLPYDASDAVALALSSGFYCAQNDIKI